MMKIFKGISLGVLALCTTCFGAAEEQLISEQEIQLSRSFHLEGWHDDYETALEEAAKKNCPLLIAFLGPNWCLSSDKLEAEILVEKSFYAPLEKEVVFLKVDIPEDFAIQDTHPAVVLKERFGIEECPTLILIEPSGNKMAELDYLPLKGSTFASYIVELIHDFRELEALTEEKQTLKELAPEELKGFYVKAGKLADETFKKALLSRGIKSDPGPYFLLEKYGDRLAHGKVGKWRSRLLRKKIEAMDPENSYGAQRKLAIMDFRALVDGVKKPVSVETAIAPLTTYLKSFGKVDADHAWKIEMMISRYLFGKEKLEEALLHAQSSLKLAPKSEQTEIRRSIEYLQARASKEPARG